MSCSNVVCSLEAVQQDSRSIGPVKDSETVCRAAFDPGNYNTRGIKQALVSNNQLKLGQVSVWRIVDHTDHSFETVVSKLTPPPLNRTRELFAIRVDVLRALVPNSVYSRRFCVLDECDTDLNGGFDPTHAHISFCREVKFKDQDKDDPEFQNLRV